MGVSQNLSSRRYTKLFTNISGYGYHAGTPSPATAWRRLLSPSCRGTVSKSPL